MASESFSKVPASTSACARRSYSSADPSHQWMSAGCVRAATSSTHCLSLAWFVGASVTVSTAPQGHQGRWMARLYGGRPSTRGLCSTQNKPRSRCLVTDGGNECPTPCAARRRPTARRTAFRGVVRRRAGDLRRHDPLPRLRGGHQLRRRRPPGRAASGLEPLRREHGPAGADGPVRRAVRGPRPGALRCRVPRAPQGQGGPRHLPRGHPQRLRAPRPRRARRARPGGGGADPRRRRRVSRCRRSTPSPAGCSPPRPWPSGPSRTPSRRRPTRRPSPRSGSSSRRPARPAAGDRSGASRRSCAGPARGA